MSPWVVLALVMLCTTILKPAGLDQPRATKPQPSRVSLAYTSAVHQDLVSLPAPEEKVVAAVYDFRDQTGQYKYSPNVSTYSRAVTQGATSMLVKALEETGWFILIEREGLPHLLKERDIISSMRQQYKSSQGQPLPPLPPLLYAGVILEGGIISYDTNLLTGGLGATYFGLGGDVQYRKDQVTIYLRAVSTQSGKILKSVATTKAILSKEVHLGLFRFVRPKKLLEAETGFTTNEPPQMCVLEAIEKAVLSLIIEGIDEGIWELENPEALNSPIIQSYLEEKKEVKKLLPLDEEAQGVSAQDLR